MNEDKQFVPVERLREAEAEIAALRALNKSAVALISSENRQIGAIKNSLAYLREACLNLLEYRKHNTLNFQLEKLDDYLRDIQTVMDEQDTGNQTPAHDAGKDAK